MNKAVREFSGGFFRSFCLIKKNQKIKAASDGLLASCTPLFTPQTRAPRSNSDALGRSVPLARFTPTRQRPELMDNGQLTMDNFPFVGADTRVRPSAFQWLFYGKTMGYKIGRAKNRTDTKKGGHTGPPPQAY